MKHLFLILLGTFFISSTLLAQEVEWGPVQDKKNGFFSEYHFLGHDAKYYYVNEKPKKKGGTLLKYDFNHRLASRKSIGLKISNRYLFIQDIIETKGGRFVYAFDYFARKLKVMVSTFDEGRIGTVKETYEQDFKDIGYLNKGNPNLTSKPYTLLNEKNGTKIVVSDNKEFAAFTCTFGSLNKGDEKLGIVVFDENMEQKWKKELVPGYKDKEMIIWDVLVADDGSVYVLARVKTEKKFKGDLKWEYKIFHVSEDKNKEIDIALSDNNRAINVGMFQAKGTNDICIGGVYTSPQNKKRGNGVFFGVVNSSEPKNKFISHPFGEKILSEVSSWKKLNYYENLDYGFSIDHLIAHSDGTFSFIAEKAYGGGTLNKINTDGSIKSTGAQIMHTDELVVSRFTREGDLINVELVEKEFSSSIKNLTSYSYFEKDDKIYLIFNDDKKWREKKDLEKSKVRIKTRFTDICIINAKGEIEKREVLFTSGEIDCFYTPKLSFFTGGKLMIRADKTKKYRYGVFEVK